MDHDNGIGLSEVENIKTDSNYLRGTIVEGLADAATGALAEADTQLTKFHGIYQQDDRDLRAERQQQRLEPTYSFMIRARVPGGVCTPQQWLEIDALASRYANESLRITTRQAFQLHGVIKRELKSTMAAINATLLDTLAACGDVNRNVMCSPNPTLSSLHGSVWEISGRISDHLTPRTSAYHEIWLDGAKQNTPESEPIYGPTYLPRKFKIGVAVPPWNDVDVFSQDLGFIAITEDGRLTGFNVAVGGGMGVTHGDPATYPRVADVIGFCQPDQVLDVAEQVVGIQRDYGDRTNRKHARFKYTIDDRGLDWLRAELDRRLDASLAPARPFRFVSNGDRYGWTRGEDGNWHLTLYVPSGRVADTDARPLMTGLRRIAASLAELLPTSRLESHQGEFRLTPNQNVIVANVTESDKNRIEAIAREHRLLHEQVPSALRLGSLACVALPTCSLAMAESERYLPDLMTRLEAILATHDLLSTPITLRMTGCPNGCARPYLAEIGLVGKGPGRYNLFLGGDHAGRRLNRLIEENADERRVLGLLEPLLARYAAERTGDEPFGDFLLRTSVLDDAADAGVTS